MKFHKTESGKTKPKKEVCGLNHALMVLVLLAGCVLAACGAARAQTEVTAGLDIASAYVDRGATVSDSAVLQPYIEFESGRFGIGVWGNINTSDDDEPGSWQFSEIEFSVSYTAGFGPGEVTVEYAEYTFPGQEDKADREIGVTAGFEGFLDPSVFLGYGVGGGINGDIYAEAGISREIQLDGGFRLFFDAAAGYLRPDEGKSGFSHYTAGAGAGYGPFAARLEYTGRIDEDVLGDDYDVSLVWMFQVSHAF